LDKKAKSKLGAMAHTCNPSYSRDRNQDCSSNPAWAKKLVRPHLNQKARYGGAHLSPSYAGSINRRIIAKASLSKNIRPLFNN
jgi:hypothetical protein